MAKRKSTRKQTKKQNRQQGRSSQRPLMIGLALVVVGLLAFGAWQWLNWDQAAGRTTLAVADSQLEVTSLDERQTDGGGGAEPATDRETRYLGPNNDPPTLQLAEAGELGQPALIFFHADW